MYNRFPDVHIFSALIRISYQSSSGVESESTKNKKNYEGVVGLYITSFSSYPACKKDVVGRSVVCSFIPSFIHYRSVIPNSLPSFHRHSSFVRRSSTYLTTASLVLVANRRFFCFLSTCKLKGVATFASGGENRGGIPVYPPLSSTRARSGVVRRPTRLFCGMRHAYVLIEREREGGRRAYDTS